MSGRQLYTIQPVGINAWPQSEIAEITVFGLGPAKQAALNIFPTDEDWKHQVNWHLKDGVWRLCVEPHWGTHNCIAHLFKTEVRGGQR